MIADPVEVAAAAISREARSQLAVALGLLGITDAKELLATLDKKDRYRIKRDLTKTAKQAATLREYVSGLTPVQQAYLVMHGRESEVVFDLAKDNGARWRATAFAAVNWGATK